MEYPTVTVGGRIYIVKFNQLAEYLISSWGFELSELLSIIRPREENAPNNPKQTAYILQLFAACTAHNFTTATPRQQPLTVEEWMLILPEDRDIYRQIGSAVVQSVIKTLSERAMKAGPTPTVETTGQPVQ